MKQNIKKQLSAYLKKCQNNKKYHLGYPYNLNCDDFCNLGIFLKYFINNLGDSFIESNYKIDARDFEKKILYFFSKLWKIKKNELWGYVTNSGTEGNLLGILYGREYLNNPILITSKASHYSINKACKMYKIKYTPIDTDLYGELDYKSLDTFLKNNLKQKLLIVANIGTTVTGAIDKVYKIKEILTNNNILRENYYIHCDAALSGCFIPLIDEAKEYFFGFDLDVDSISVSGHKFLGTPVPCGVVITKKKHMKKWGSNIEYLNSIDTTIGGSRSGFAILCMWYSLFSKTENIMKKELYECFIMADKLINDFKNISIKAWRNNFSIIVVFPKPIESIVQKYQLACEGSIAHIVVTPSVTTNILDNFIKDYRNYQISIKNN